MAINLQIRVPREPLSFKIIINVFKEIQQTLNKIASILENLENRITALE